MTVLMGCQLESAYQVHTLVESTTIPGRIDAVYIEQRDSFRRLREGVSRSIVCGVPAPHPQDASIERTTLFDGRPVGNDPHEALIPAFCSPQLPRMHTTRRGASLLLSVDPGVPTPGEPMTVATGVITRGTAPRWATAERKYDSFGVTMRKPVAVLVFDMLIHRGLGIPMPTVTLNVAGGPPTDSPAADAFDAIDQPVSVQSLGPGTRRMACRGVRDAKAIAEHSVERSGKPAEEFDAYRVMIEYPAPGLTTRIWVRLPEPTG